MFDQVPRPLNVWLIRKNNVLLVESRVVRLGMECLFPSSATNRRLSRVPKSPPITKRRPISPLKKKLVWETEDADDLRHLLERQAEHMPRAVKELEKHGRKTSHWAWWAFPTEKPGASEPDPKTCVTLENAGHLCERAPPSWRQCLEKIADLVESSDLVSVLPTIDHGRVVFFIKFWRDHDDTPLWLHRVIQKLEKSVACKTQSAKRHDALTARLGLEPHADKIKSKSIHHTKKKYDSSSSSSDDHDDDDDDDPLPPPPPKNGASSSSSCRDAYKPKPPSSSSKDDDPSMRLSREASSSSSASRPSSA